MCVGGQRQGEALLCGIGGGESKKKTRQQDRQSTTNRTGLDSTEQRAESAPSVPGSLEQSCQQRKPFSVSAFLYTQLRCTGIRARISPAGKSRV